ncbi:MAG: hypothetical protein ACR2KL_06385 [Nocardioidaceae bacterium]
MSTNPTAADDGREIDEIDEIAGLDAADVEEQHDSDDDQERAGRSHFTKRELGQPAAADDSPDQD